MPADTVFFERTALELGGLGENTSFQASTSSLKIINEVVLQMDGVDLPEVSSSCRRPLDSSMSEEPWMPAFCGLGAGWTARYWRLKSPAKLSVRVDS